MVIGSINNFSSSISFMSIIWRQSLDSPSGDAKLPGLQNIHTHGSEFVCRCENVLFCIGSGVRIFQGSFCVYATVLFLLRSGETLLTLFLVQEWLGSRRATAVAHFLKTSVCGGSRCTDSSFSPLLVELSQGLESAFPDNLPKAAVIPVACAPFPTTLLPSGQLSMNIF